MEAGVLNQTHNKNCQQQQEEYSNILKAQTRSFFPADLSLYIYIEKQDYYFQIQLITKNTLLVLYSYIYNR